MNNGIKLAIGNKTNRKVMEYSHIDKRSSAYVSCDYFLF